VAWTTIRYATGLALNGKYTEAEAAVRRGWEDYERFGPLQGPGLLSAQWTLGAALAGQNRFAEAEPLLVESCSQIATSPWRTLYWKALITMYENWGKPEQAAHWRAIQESVQPNHP
jgi:hypothetical protein